MIDTNAGLAPWLPQLRAAPWLALDTEADSLHAYPEKVCLLQLSIPGHDLLIDPLADIDLVPLLEIFRGHELLMHGSDYDLRLLRKHHGFVAGRIFDTMLAARLIGLTEFGLSNLVERFLNVRLEKASQKANWARRPLTEKMADYARNDTRHLRALVDLLQAELVRLGRLEWHTESCLRLIEECSTTPAGPDPDAWRIKGANRLDRQAQAILREIWKWRETQALRANRPPFHILRNETMMQLAADMVRQPDQIHLPPHLNSNRAASLLDVLRRAARLPASEWPEPLRREGLRLTDAQVKRADAIKAVRDRHAERLGIDPSLIAPRAALYELAHDWDRAAAGLMKWQVALLKP